MRMDSPLSMLSSERDQRLHLSGTRIDGRRNDPKTYSDGRVCEARDCRTILSRYNGQSRCWQHEVVRPYLLRGGRRPAEVEVLRDLAALGA
jgi:hypothetical protein